MQSLSDQLTRYHLAERIGSGGMSIVYRARDRNLNRDVAIKILHEHLVDDPTFCQRFEQEAQLIANFHHPHIIQIFDFDKLSIDGKQTYYMVMPLLTGNTLTDLLEQNCARGMTLPHKRVMQIIDQIASALDYAHKRDMVHRDIKPANIIFDEREQAILTDFGIARLVNTAGLTQEGTIIGTPTYMSPEQATGQESDRRSDIYSLGVIAFEMLTGRPPFDADSAVSLLVKHAHEQPPEISDYLAEPNPALNRVLNRVLAKLPEARYQTAVEFASALRHALSTEATTTFAEPQIIPDHARKPSSPPETAVLSELTPPVEQASLTQTILQEVRNRPVGFLALAVAVIALLIAARLTTTEFTGVDPTASTEEDAEVSSMVGRTAFFETTFADDDPYNQYWQQNSVGSVTRTITDDGYRILSTQRDRASISLFDPSTATYDNLQVILTGELNAATSDRSSAYGIIFRYQDAANFYVFAVDGRGRYSIWKLEDGTWCELRSACDEQDFNSVWTPGDAINPAGEANQLLLDAHDETLYAYANGEFLFMLDDPTFTDVGGIGVYVATSENGDADVTIQSYAVMESQPATGAMTGDS